MGWEFPSYLEYGYPGVANIVEVHSSLVRVALAGETLIIVLVPVNTAVNTGPTYRGRALRPAFGVGWHIVAAQHPVLAGSRADEWVVFAFLSHVIRIYGQVVHPARE